MQHIYTAAQMRAADSYTIETLGTPSEELMRRAGECIAEEVASVAAAGDKILVVCGTGNNGGDGYVCARNLLSRGLDAGVLALEGTLSADCERERARYTGQFLQDVEGDIIVDCIFGTGLSRAVEGRAAEVIEAINACAARGALVVAADIPSGLSGDSGKVLGTAVRAAKTVAIGGGKTGFYLSDGLDYCGEIVVKDIGISSNEGNLPVIYEEEDVAALYPPRPRNSHKGTFGTACLVCGSAQYTGSAVLAVAAALRSGCGYVKAVCPEEVRAAISPNYPQTVFSPQCDLNSAAIAIGMGCGISRSLHEHIASLLAEYGGTLIIDADGLNSLAAHGTDILLQKSCNVILTPHVKEFSRLSGIKVADVLADPVACAQEFSNEYNVVTVLKGAGTVITDGKSTVINVRGSSALAKAGSGDMLAGYMAGSIARGLSPMDGAICAAYTLGAAAELAADEVTGYCATFADILNKIPAAVKIFASTRRPGV